MQGVNNNCPSYPEFLTIKSSSVCPETPTNRAACPNKPSIQIQLVLPVGFRRRQTCGLARNWGRINHSVSIQTNIFLEAGGFRI
jgi:hypothetical protein